MNPVSPLIIAGVDEAGRGALAGPVVAAAVILNPNHLIKGLCDSKQLSAKQRETLFCQITQFSMAYSLGYATVAEIDKLNIYHASLLAMARAVNGLPIAPQQVLVDGNAIPNLDYPCQAIVKGDQTVETISAASILAKVDRDRTMQALDKQYPGYQFSKHKGYGTRIHLTALQQLGPSNLHRQTFGPVKQLKLAKPCTNLHDKDTHDRW